MIREGRFGVYEAICLTAIAITNKVFYTSPALLMDLLATTPWYMTLISALTATLGFTFIYLLLKRFPNMDLVSIYKETFGSIIGSISAVLLSSFLLLISFATIREFVDVMKVYVMPRSSIEYLVIIFLLVIAVLCYYGLETIARFSKLCAHMLLIGLVVVLLLAYQNYDIDYLFPFLGRGIMTTVRHGLMRSSSYGEVIMLAVIAPSLQGTKYLKRAGYLSIAISGLIISVTLLSFNLSFPYTVGAELTSPMYELMLQIGYGRFFQKIDPIFLFVWVMSSFIAVSVLAYGSLSVYAKTFDIPDLRPCIPPFLIIMFCLTMVPSDLMTIVTGFIQSIRTYGWIIYFVAPLVALITAKIRGKKGAMKGG